MNTRVSLPPVWLAGCFAASLAAGLVAAPAAAWTRTADAAPGTAHPVSRTAVSPTVAPATGATAPPGSAIPGLAPAHLAPEFWVRRLSQPDRVLLEPDEISRQNTRLVATDASLHDLSALPPVLGREQVLAWIEGVSRAPQAPRYSVDGVALDAAGIQQLIDEMALASIPAHQETRFGLVVRRSPLRTFPTARRMFSAPGDTDIDRFQESALFPGTPVAIVHASGDGRWLFVLSPRYAAWVPAADVAEGPRDQVLAYAAREPYRIVTGARERTVFNPEEPAVSQVPLDMGVRLPVMADWPADRPVHGQHPLGAHVVALPLRGVDGRLRLAPALLPGRADSRSAPLPLTTANIVTQAFKFLGERYGWGHDYDGRDCSGFVSEVFASMGMLLPRNTGDQARSPALRPLLFDGEGDASRRRAALATLQPGDLVHIPGHVMLVIGQVDGETFVIHDTPGIRLLEADGRLQLLRLNGVAVSPLAPLRFEDGSRYVDRVSSIVRPGTSVGAEPLP